MGEKLQLYPMEEIINKAEELVIQVREYVDVKVEKVKLEVVDKSSKIVADLIARIIIFLVVGLIVMFASMAVAYVLGEAWGKIWLGFLVVSGFYLFVSILIWMTRDKWIRIPIVNAMLNLMTKKEEEDED